jgi:hypothetical protein
MSGVSPVDAFTAASHVFMFASMVVADAPSAVSMSMTTGRSPASRPPAVFRLDATRFACAVGSSPASQYW